MGNNRGSILVFTLTTIAALMIVGLTFTTIATSEYRAAMAHTESVQAFYIAEAGINWFMHALDSGGITLPQGLAVGGTQVYTSPQLSDIGSVQITAVRTTEGFNILSQGLMNNAKKTVSIKLEVGSGGGNGFGSASVFGPVQLDNGNGSSRIIGNLVASSVNFRSWSSYVDGNVQIIGDTIEGKIIPWNNRKAEDHISGTISNITTAPSFKLPSLSWQVPPNTPSKGSFTAVWNTTTPFPGGGSYESINIQGTLEINIPDSNDIVVWTKNLTVSGNKNQDVVITGAGSGRVIFHVQNTLSISGSGKINSNGNFEKVDILYYGTQSFTLTGEDKIGASIIAPSSIFNLSGGSRVFGHIVTASNSVKIVGNAEADLKVLYAPNAHIDLGNSGKLRGVVIGASLIGVGNARITLDERAAASFTRLAGMLDLWNTGDAYIYHTWGGR